MAPTGPMTESSAREWLYASKSKGMSLGIERVNAALEALGRPDRDMDCIHVAGSNGKEVLALSWLLVW